MPVGNDTQCEKALPSIHSDSGRLVVSYDKLILMRSKLKEVFIRLLVSSEMYARRVTSV